MAGETLLPTYLVPRQPEMGHYEELPPLVGIDVTSQAQQQQQQLQGASAAEAPIDLAVTNSQAEQAANGAMNTPTYPSPESSSAGYTQTVELIAQLRRHRAVLEEQRHHTEAALAMASQALLKAQVKEEARSSGNSPIASPRLETFDLESSPGPQRRRRTKPAYLPCNVCGDKAPNHVHYGGIACFSCRAFFRRSVPKVQSYFCVNSGNCVITETTRKNCQFCRFQKCLVVGMKPAWVLSDTEKMERMEKKKNKRYVFVKDIKEKSTVCFDFMEPAHQVSFNLEEDRLLTEWLYAQESTRHTVPIPAGVMSEVVSLTKKPAKMNANSVLQLINCVYTRVVIFAKYVDEFQTLSDGDKRMLLNRNLDMLANIRIVTCFTSSGKGDLQSQWKQMGTCSETAPGEQAIELEQVFEPWSSGPSHTSIYCSTIRSLAGLINGDVKIALLFQLVALFHSTEMPVRDKKYISRAQENMSYLLQRYLLSKMERHEAIKTFSKLMLRLADLRLLADRIRSMDISTQAEQKL